MSSKKTGSVLAKSIDKQEEELIKACDLSIYTVEDDASEREDRTPVPVANKKDDNFLKSSIRETRTLFEERFKDVKEPVQMAQSKVMSHFDSLQNGSNILPRVGVIAGTGAAGLVWGALRGSRVKKIVYPIIGAASASCLCYPNEAVKAANYCKQYMSQAGLPFQTEQIKNKLRFSEMPNLGTLLGNNNKIYQKEKEFEELNVQERLKKLREEGNRGQSRKQDDDMYSKKW